MTGASENSEWDNNLPQRLFATDQFPSKRLNVYSKVETLIFVKKTLEGTEDFETIKSSCFGKLFDLPAVRCSISGKLIHALLTRQLVTKKKYVLWTVLGGQPLRFSLAEFGAITGLPCGEFEEDYDHEYQLPAGDASYEYWEKLIGPDRHATLADIVGMLRDNPSMPSWRRIRLALILIVDGVLISSTQLHKPTPKYVKLVENLGAFMVFPWGRESFLWTLSSMKPKRKVMGNCENPVDIYRDQLKQTSFRLVGFPLVLQLIALEAIPVLLGKLGKALEGVTLLEFSDNKLSKSSAVTLTQVLDAEADPKLVVKPIMDYKGAKMDGWCEWDDEIKDRKVDYMEKLINCSHVFKKSDWPGRDASVAFARQKKKKAVDVSRKKNVVESKEEDSSSKRIGVGKKKSGIKKQQRLSGYCVKGVEAMENKLDLLIGRVEELTQELRKMNERLDKAEKRGRGRKQRRVRKFSSRKRGSGCGIKRKRSQEPMPEVGKIESEGLSDERAFTLTSLKGNDGVSSQWIKQTKWKSDSGEKMVDGNESGGNRPKHLRTRVDRMEETKIASGGEGPLNEGKVGTSGSDVEEEMKDEKANISDGHEAMDEVCEQVEVSGRQDVVDERGTSRDVMKEGENEILSSLILIGEGDAEKDVCEQEAVNKETVDEVCQQEAVDKVGCSGPGVEEVRKDEQVNESGGQEIADEVCEQLNVPGGEQSVNEVVDPPLRSASSEQKNRGRKRKTPEELPIVAHATESSSVLPQVKPTQKKEESSPNGSARGIVILFLKFYSHESMPSRDELTSMFSAFGPLNFSETHVSEESSSAQVAFVSTGDAIKALKGLKEGSPFGETLVSFRLQPKMISVQGANASLISDFCPVLKLINTPTSVDSMKQNLFLND